MFNKIAVASLALLIGTTAWAAPGPFKTGIVSVDQAKSNRLKNIPGNQLYVCNSTNLPAQSGMPIQVSFPQAGVPDQTPQPGSCAYLSNDGGGFNTQVTITASGNNIFNSNLNSGQMWAVTYNSQTNAYPVNQIQ